MRRLVEPTFGFLPSLSRGGYNDFYNDNDDEYENYGNDGYPNLEDMLIDDTVPQRSYPSSYRRSFVNPESRMPLQRANQQQRNRPARQQARTIPTLQQHPSRRVTSEAQESQPWVPPADIGESQTHVQIVMELPGVRKEDVSLEVSPDRSTLIVSGDIMEMALASGDRITARERPRGNFSRKFAIPKNVDGTHMTAKMVDGVLTISLPKITPGKQETFTIPVTTAHGAASSAPKTTPASQAQTRQIPITSQQATTTPAQQPQTLPAALAVPTSDLSPLTSDGGVKYKTLRKGYGLRNPEKKDIVYTHLVIYRPDNSVLFSTREAKPLSFTVGMNQVFKGLEKAVVGMKEGELAVVVCTAQYFAHPPNAKQLFVRPVGIDVLQCEVELVAVEEDLTDVVKDGGISKRILLEGRGPKVSDDCHVLINYKATDVNGFVMEAKEFSCTIGGGKLPLGLEAGLLTMARGDVCVLTLTPEYQEFLDKSLNATSTDKRIPLQYYVALLDICPPVPSDKMPVDERIKSSEQKRLQGNELYQHKLMRAALSKYLRALELVSCEEGMSTAEKESVTQQRAKCLLNSAACYLALKMPSKAYEYCDKSLALDNGNVKAWIRRGRCNAALGEWERASQDFTTALEKQPDNEEAKQELQSLGTRKASSDRMERRRFAQMLKSLSQPSDS
ncbi:peptidyl-prolyl cis-trans isomerase FKBP4 [Pelomyxa schiedti]|nr:peptidyl-prolyl cis-trans isomerase FKBP4 [Pelomyxa schiedti]